MTDDRPRRRKPAPKAPGTGESSPARRWPTHAAGETAGADETSPAEGWSRVTRDVRVSVRSFYLDDQSRPDDAHFVWAYRVRIENRGREPVQLLRRTWHITDARGRTQYVHGEGVVGEQPVLEPGETFEYTSGTPLDTPSGFMRGAYHMLAPASGESFDVSIPIFSLDSPHQGGVVH